VAASVVLAVVLAADRAVAALMAAPSVAARLAVAEPEVTGSFYRSIFSVSIPPVKQIIPHIQ
jgi:hypothetical protein